jgi:hypothetical protein
MLVFFGSANLFGFGVNLLLARFEGFGTGKASDLIAAEPGESGRRSPYENESDCGWFVVWVGIEFAVIGICPVPE